MTALRVTFLSALLAAQALAGSFPAETVLQDQTLQLNGKAIRTVWGFSVYEIGLYLAQPSKDAGHIMREDRDAKRVRILMMRHVSQSRFSGTVQESVDQNFSASEKEQFSKELATFLGCFHNGADLREGSVVTIDYVPEQGMVVGVDGSRMAVIPGQDFYHAVLRLWLGKPLQPSIKDGLLGAAG